MDDAPRYDAVVVGGGAAGLSGAVALARSRRSVLVVDAGQPSNAPAEAVHNYLGREGTPPGDLLALGRADLAGYGGEVGDDRLTGVHLVSGEIVPRPVVVVAPRFTARAAVLEGLGLQLPEQEMAGSVVGSVAAEPTGATAVPGVWVAGNVSDLSAQVVGAAAAGLRTGAMINADLVAEDARLAVDQHRRIAA